MSRHSSTLRERHLGRLRRPQTLLQMAGVALLLAGLVSFGLTLTAGADSGVTLTAPSPNSPSGQTVTPSTPFSSGQTINVSVSAAAVVAAGMTNGAGIAIEECAAPGGVDPASPATVGTCDGNTHQSPTVTASTTKGITLNGYFVYALPDPNLAELSGGMPQCDLTHECVLYIGQDQNSASAPHIYSPGFFVDPGDGTDGGADPGDGSAPSGDGLTVHVNGRGQPLVRGGRRWRRRLHHHGDPARLVQPRRGQQGGDAAGVRRELDHHARGHGSSAWNYG